MNIDLHAKNQHHLQTQPFLRLANLPIATASQHRSHHGRLKTTRPQRPPGSSHHKPEIICHRRSSPARTRRQQQKCVSHPPNPIHTHSKQTLGTSIFLRSSLRCRRAKPTLPLTPASPSLSFACHRIIGLTTVSVTGVAYFLFRETDPGSDNVAANKSDAIVNNFDAIQTPQLNARAPKTREERQREGQHPEDLDPKYRAEFGRQHARKRVDEPPSGRNHQALSDKSKENAKV